MHFMYIKPIFNLKIFTNRVIASNIIRISECEKQKVFSFLNCITSEAKLPTLKITRN